VGNLAVGGTGKSPMVEVVLRLLSAKGKFPVVLTRGYRSGVSAGSIAVYLGGERVAEKDIYRDIFPDEARMLSAKMPLVPIVVSPSRFEAAQWFRSRAEKPITHWVLDDGFQHFQLARDVDLLLLDALTFERKEGRFFGFRESLSGAARADAIIWTRCTDKAPSTESQGEIKAVSDKPQLKAFFTMSLPVSMDRNQSYKWNITDPISVFCGISHSERFEEGLRKMGVSILQMIRVWDHGQISPKELEKKMKGSRCLMTTEKDYYRNPALFHGLSIPFLVVPLQVEVDESLLVSILDV